MMETRAQNQERLADESRSSATSDVADSFGIPETEVGGTAGLGEAALGAYREMASAAMAVDRADMLYTLLFLSVSHPLWKVSANRENYGSATLLGFDGDNRRGGAKSLVEMRSVLRPHLGKLLPRLLRAKHDPNKQTRDQMETLWIGLTGGGAQAREAITLHLLPTIDTLVEDAANKLWRARVGACGALSEVLAGRTWKQLGGGEATLDVSEVMFKMSSDHTPAGVRLLRLWRAAVRALDDVRLSVRESGETLGRSIRALTIRLCDPLATDNGSDVGETRSAAATALQWLVKHGLDQTCDAAVGLCVSTLIGIVDVVKPATLQPVLSGLIGALLMALSNLEPAALNYLQVRAAGQGSESNTSYEQLERARLQFAQTGPIAGALNKCLEMVPVLETNAQREIIPELDSALRRGTGKAFPVNIGFDIPFRLAPLWLIVR